MKRHLAPLLASLVLLATTTALALAAGDPAPDFTLVDSNGQQVQLASLRGKVVLVDFWASWCGPCRESFPALERIQARYRSRGLVVLGVSEDQQESAFREFLRTHPVSFRLARDTRQTVARAFRPPAMPTSYVIDREGVVRYVQRGYRASETATLSREIERWLGNGAGSQSPE